MRSNLLHFGLQLTAIVGLTAVAIAQTEDPPEPIGVPEPTVIVVQSDSELEGSTLSNASPGMLKKLEDWIGLTDVRMEELASKAEKILTEIAKLKKLRSEATSVLQTQVPAQLMLGLVLLDLIPMCKILYSPLHNLLIQEIIL